MAWSGGASSTSRPPSKRPLSGACRSGIAAGGRSAESTTCAPALERRLDRVEELLGGALLALEELDVVEQQDVGGAVAVLERRDLVVLERGQELAREGLGVGVAHGQAAHAQGHVVADGLQEVGLADSGRTADEQRVVDLAGQFGDGE